MKEDDTHKGHDSEDTDGERKRERATDAATVATARCCWMRMGSVRALMPCVR